jgi:GNAT superfamily N-acetyltransferase
MQIRRARSDDAPRLVALYEQWGYGQPAKAIAERLALWSATVEAEVLVAEIDGALAGMVGVFSSPHLALPGRYGRIAGLSVDGAFRRRGVGAALIGAAEELARSWGCDRIEVTSSRARSEAPGFYPAVGYEDVCARSARFIRPL